MQLLLQANFLEECRKVNKKTKQKKSETRKQKTSRHARKLHVNFSWQSFFYFVLLSCEKRVEIALTEYIISL